MSLNVTAFCFQHVIFFSTQQKFEALYEIIKKQDERIKELEIILKNK